MTDRSAPDRLPLREHGLVRAHGYTALAMAGFSALLGLVAALELNLPAFLSNTAWTSYGKIRPAHVQGILFGWLGNAFFAFLYHAVPALAGRRVVSRRLGIALYVIWNFLFVIPGWGLVLAGMGQWLEWSEFPIATDFAAIVALALACVQFVVPIVRVRLSDLYISGWYIAGGLVFTLLVYPVGNFAPEVVPGVKGANYSGLWIHDAVGLYVTPLAVAIAYHLIPAITGKPIFSHFLSMVAFWLLFFIYPLNGTHHYVFSSIPMSAQLGAIVASIYLGMDVLLNVTNQLLSLKGSGKVVARDPALRFIWLSIVCYLIVSLQGSAQAVMPLNRFLHFSDWVIGHAHLAMIGFASFAAIGGLLYVWPKTPGARCRPGAASLSFWLLSLGMAAMVADLTIAGIAQASAWENGAAWIASVRVSHGFWWIRSLSGIVILLGFSALALAMLSGPRVEPIAGEDSIEPNDAPAPKPRPRGALDSALLMAALAGAGCFLLSFVVLAILPNRELDRRVEQSAPADLPAISAAAERGRAVYGREGCVQCHTQFVRFTAADVDRFGPPSQAWESYRDLPELWGTRRVGPDLARESGKKSRDWQLTHLFNPRLVVPDSPMPGHPWLFAGSPLAPTRDALDLLAYLESLGRDALVAEAKASDLDLDRALNAYCGLDPRLWKPRPRTQRPLRNTPVRDDRPREAIARDGSLVFARECSGCHDPVGSGDGPAALFLLPAPRDLTHQRYDPGHLERVIALGIAGSAMPAFDRIDQRDLAALLAYLDAIGQTEPAPTLTDHDRALAAGLYAKHCAICHGATGAGDGFSSPVLFPRPTDFRSVDPRAGAAVRAITDGIAGSAMPGWSSKLDKAQIELLASYVRLISKANKSNK